MEQYLRKYELWINEVWEKLDKKLSLIAVRSRNKLPYTTKQGVHDNKFETDPAWWTNGFWGAMMWIMYLGTKNEEYKITAERCEEMLDAALRDFNNLHHDVGFMWNITSGVNYRLTGNKKSETRWSYAAAVLSSRYNINGGFIRAWNNWWGEGSAEGITIIDCMMNIPLLYRMADKEKDDRYKAVADGHAQMAMRDHIRPDGSVNHIVRHNPKTGEVIENIGGQGFAKGSSWSRGQSWALYGFVLAYIHTHNDEYLDAAKRVAHYFISNVAINDYLPLVDFRAPCEPVLYDSTAGACAACGLIEIAKYVPEYEKKMYLDAAVKMLMAMERNFCNWNEDEDSILQMGAESYNAKRQMPIIYGDHFFAEAIYKLKGNDFIIW